MDIKLGGIVTIAAASLLLGACGSDGDAKTTTSASASTSTATSASASASESTSASDSASSSAPSSSASTSDTMSSSASASESTAAAGSGSGADKTYDDTALAAIIAKSDGAAGAMKPIGAAELARSKKQAAAGREAAAKAKTEPAACAAASKRTSEVYTSGKLSGEAMSTVTRPANVTSLSGFSSVDAAKDAMAALHDAAASCSTVTTQTTAGKVSGTTTVKPLSVAGADTAEVLVQDMSAGSNHQKSTIAHARVGTVVVQSIHLMREDQAGATRDLEGVVKTLLADQK